MQGDDGTDRKNVTVDATSGNLQVDVSTALPAGTNAIGKLAANSGVDIGDVDVTSTVHPVGLSTVAVGERQGSATAAQMPSVACDYVRIKACVSNAGNVYIGGSGVTKPDGTTDTTTGFELAPGDDTGWLPASNLSLFYLICDNATDDVTYMALT
jgi:hypothetical protein